MTDILERLRWYNPPDRTGDEQRQIAIDIHEAANEIKRLRKSLLHYGLHTWDCAWNDSRGEKPCDCGWADIGLGVSRAMDEV